MSEQEGIYEIANNEGMICYVDTATEGKKTYGQDWVDVCESTLNGTILKGEIAKYQLSLTMIAILISAYMKK